MGTPVIRKYALMYPERCGRAGPRRWPGAVSEIQAVERPQGRRPTLSGPAAGKRIIRSMFGPVTTPALQEHILKMMMAPSEAAAAAPSLRPGIPAVVGSENHHSRPGGVRRDQGVAPEQAVKTLYPNAEYSRFPRRHTS